MWPRGDFNYFRLNMQKTFHRRSDGFTRILKICLAIFGLSERSASWKFFSEFAGKPETINVKMGLHLELWWKAFRRSL
jgi:hypothetical protein